MIWKTVFAHRITKLIGLGTIAGSFFLAQPYRPVIVKGTSMTPTYKSGEFVLSSTNTKNLKVGDVVVIDAPNGTIIKRIAFLPGDTINRYRIADGWEYPFSFSFNVMKHSDKFPKISVPVPEGYVFVLGDNSETSVDSRQMGVLPISSIRSVIVDSRAKVEMTYDMALAMAGK